MQKYYQKKKKKRTSIYNQVKAQREIKVHENKTKQQNNINFFLFFTSKIRNCFHCNLNKKNEIK